MKSDQWINRVGLLAVLVMCLFALGIKSTLEDIQQTENEWRNSYNPSQQRRYIRECKVAHIKAIPNGYSIRCIGARRE